MKSSTNKIWKRHSAVLVLISVLLVGIGFMAIASSATASTDVDQDGVPDDVELANARDVHVNITASDVVINSLGAQDKLLFDVNLTSQGLVIQTTYWQNGNIPSQSDGFVFTITSLIQFNDLNLDGIYTPDIDGVVSTYIPKDWIFKSIKDDTTRNGYTTIILQTNDGHVDAVLHVGSTFGLASGKLVTPTSIKFDMGINGFVFANASTKLAARFSVTRNGTSTLETTTETERLFGTTGETGIRFGASTGVRGSIAWADQVLINGTTTMPVSYGNITPSSAGLATTGYDIYITLPQGAKIQWDPRVGLDGILTTTVPSPPFPWLTIGYIAGGAIAGIVIGAVITRVITRKRIRESPTKATRESGAPSVGELSSKGNPIKGITVKGGKDDGSQLAKEKKRPGRESPTLASTGQTMVRESPSKDNLGTPNGVPEGTDASNPIPGVGIVVKHNPKATAARGKKQPGRESPTLASTGQTTVRESPSKVNLGTPNVVPEGTEQSNPIPGIGIVVKHNPKPSAGRAMQPDKVRESPSKGNVDGTDDQPEGSSQANPVPGIGIIVKKCPGSPGCPTPQSRESPTNANLDESIEEIRESPTEPSRGQTNARGNPIKGITVKGGKLDDSQLVKEKKRPGRESPTLQSTGQTTVRESPSKASLGKTNGEKSGEKASIHQELHRPPTFTIEQMDVSITKLLDGATLSPAEAKGLKHLGQKLRYGNPLSDAEIDSVSKILSYTQGMSVDAREPLSHRNSHDNLPEGLDEVVKIIEKATSGLKDTLKTQV